MVLGRYLPQQGRKVSLTGSYTVKFCGDLTAVREARVVNVEEAQETGAMLRLRGILDVDPDYPRDGTMDAQEEFILKATWMTLLKQTGGSTDVTHTDVDVFEQRLFEKSLQLSST